MLRTTPFVTGETYHIYNRGAHKQLIFTDESDYRRFELLLYLANDQKPIQFSNLQKKYGGYPGNQLIFEGETHEQQLVEIFAYCLMPNHFHLILRQKVDGGISLFMKKFATGFSMYYNKKYDHSGVLFQGRFKSKHINNNSYFRYIFAYIHLNPLDLFIPNWAQKGIPQIKKARAYMSKYTHTSYHDYCIKHRPERNILSYKEAPDFLKDTNDVEELFKWYKNMEDRPR